MARQIKIILKSTNKHKDVFSALSDDQAIGGRRGRKISGRSTQRWFDAVVETKRESRVGDGQQNWLARLRSAMLATVCAWKKNIKRKERK